MSTEQPLSAKEVFADAIELKPDARGGFLARVCAGNPDLLDEVQGLIDSHEEAGTFLSAAPEPTGGGLSEEPGSIVGRYRLLQRIGEGGFGTVFLAEQREPVIRLVALKVLKPGMDTAQVIARFQAERQALAVMDHPNIAKVLDAGSTSRGRPYFVMEYVAGEPITAYCDRLTLTIRRRLELFIEVCQAVQHAHTKGIIHRDLKPGNILVADHEGRPQAKVIDFGVAKATDPSRTADLTELRQLIGTPQYMSPEQAAGGPDIDTRADVYSLGVVLYELLTGSTPFDAGSLRAAAYEEFQRIIREVEPPHPSTRLLKADPALSDVAACRHVEPRRLNSIVRGELDWIAMKSIDKDRSRRYESASALAADVRRYLAGDSILAAPPTLAYRVRKFAGRHRVAVAALTTVSIALLVGLAAALYGLNMAKLERDSAIEARRQADAERVSAETITTFLQTMLAHIDPDIARGRDASILKEMLDAAADRIEHGDLKDSPAAEAELRIRMSGVYRSIAELQKAGRLLAAVPEVMKLARPGDRTAAERLLAEQAKFAAAEQRYDEAIRLFTDLLRLRREIFEPTDSRIAQAVLGIASALYEQGNVREALPKCREALQLAERSGDAATIGNSHNHLMASLLSLGNPKEAAAHGERSVEIYRELYRGTDHPLLATTLTTLVSVAGMQGGDLAQAESMQREAIGMFRRLYPGGHPTLGNALNNLGWVLKAQGKLDECEPYYLEAIDILRRHQDHATVARLLINLGQVDRARGNISGAHAHATEALEICRRIFPDGHETTSFALCDIGQVLRDQGRFEDSVASYREALELHRRLLGPDHEYVAVSNNGIGEGLMRLGRAEHAAPAFREALAVRTTLSAPPAIASAQLQLALALSALDDPDSALEAEGLARAALKTRQGLLPAGDWRLANTRSVLGGAILARARLGLPQDRSRLLGEASSILIPAADELIAAQSIPAPVRRTVVRAALERAVAACDALHSMDPSLANAEALSVWKRREQEFNTTPG